MSGAFRDPDGDALTYGATSSAPAVAGGNGDGERGDGDAGDGG